MFVRKRKQQQSSPSNGYFNSKKESMMDNGNNDGNSSRRNIRFSRAYCILCGICCIVFVLKNSNSQSTRRKSIISEESRHMHVRQALEAGFTTTTNILTRHSSFYRNNDSMIRPRMVQFSTTKHTATAIEAVLADTPPLSFMEAVVKVLDPTAEVQKSFQQIYDGVNVMKKLRELEHSSDKRFDLPDSMEHDDCKAQYDWQLRMFPNCNSFHEQDMTLNNDFSYVANGAYRDVWKLRDSSSYGPMDGPPSDLVIKTLVYYRDYSPRNFDRHRRDAVAVERLSWSRYISPIYGYCSNSAIFEFATGGTLHDVIFKHGQYGFFKYSRGLPVTLKKMNSTDKLILAYQAAAAVRDAHDSDGAGRATIAHTDITPNQYVYMPHQGRFQLNDFNRCRLLAWDRVKHRICPFKVASNKGRYRSPEEYKYHGETEKVDVFMLGNILYTILTRKEVFEYVRFKDAMDKVKQGKHPWIPDKYKNKHSSSPEAAMIKAMKLCWTYNKHKRPSAKNVTNYLHSALKRHGIHDPHPTLFLTEKNE